MARRLSAKEKGELKALQIKKKLTKADRERIEYLTAGGPCANCLDMISKRASARSADSLHKQEATT
jgi:hypothetical protein